MSDSIDKPGTTNLGARTPAVQETPASSSGPELTTEMLETISAAGDASVFQLQMAQERLVQKSRDALREAHPYMRPEEIAKQADTLGTQAGFQGDSEA